MKTTEIEKTTLDIEEAGVKLRLTIVDTPGYGDGLKGADSWQTCVKSVRSANYFRVVYINVVDGADIFLFRYVDDQFAQYFEGESGLNRRSMVSC